LQRPQGNNAIAKTGIGKAEDGNRRSKGAKILAQGRDEGN